MNPRDRLRLLGQMDLGAWVEAATGSELWSIQRKIGQAASERRARVAVPSCNASGKFVRATEPVLTPEGWRQIGTLAVGDTVYTQDGTTTTVTGVFPQGRQQMYRFHLDNGVTVDSGGPHLWAVDAWDHQPGSGPRYQKTRSVLTTDDLIARYGGLGVTPNPQRRVALPMVEPIRFPERPVPVDPYLLGALLGDGGMTGGGVTISTKDPEIVAAFRDAGYTVNHRSAYDYGVLGIKQALVELHVHGHRSWEKVIPEVYLWNAPEVRLALLQGLMDTDGGVSATGTEFTTTSQKLAEQVLFLVQSLGGRASVRERVTSYSHNGERRTGRPSYRMHVTMPTCPFRLPRKQAAWEAFSASRRKTTAYTIQRIEQADVAEAVCISVDHPSRLYVIGNFIVTHNTFLAARLALAFYDAYTPGAPCAACDPTGTKGGCRGSKILTTSSKAEHLRDALWAEIRSAHAQLHARGIILPGTMARGQNLRLEDSPNHFLVGYSPNHAEGFQGFHAAHKLILGDEATSLDTQMQQGITGLLATGDSRLLLIFNPTTDDTYAALECRSPRTEIIKITAWDTPAFTNEPMPEGSNLTTPEWLDELKDKGMGPGTYEWTTRVEADFWTMGDDVLIPADSFDRAFGVPHIEGTRQLGIDLAPYGSDENVVVARDGNAVVGLHAFPAMRQDSFWEGPVADLVRRYDPHYISWDADGVGSGVYGYVDALVRKHNAAGGNIVLLPFRGGIKVDARYNNARSAWWWNLRRKFEAGTLSLAPLPPDPKLREQVTDIRYSITDAGDIKIETKDHMKRRGRESPDRGDALMYAFAMVDELPVPAKITETPLLDTAGLPDRSAEAMWRRDLEALKRGKRPHRPSPWDRVHAGRVWDDL